MSEKIAYVAIKPTLHYRRECFESGLKRCGFKIRSSNTFRQGRPGDVLVLWNRMGDGHRLGLDMEKAGGTVLVAENGYLAEQQPARHLALAIGYHNGAGKWPFNGPERWDGWNIDLKPWRQPGGETVILPQRGIGSPKVAMPHGWAQKMKALGRVRQHPGNKQFKFGLEQDLRKASEVITWGSGAAIRALTWGIPVFHAFPRWIGAQAARPLADRAQGPKTDDEARLAMFRRLAWAQYSMQEIESGMAFDTLLGMKQ